jgi:type IV secretion system protein TrbJ
MKKYLLAGVTAVALATASLAGHAAGPVFCTNCSTVTEQLLQFARQLEQLQQEIQTAENTLNFYMNAVQNTVSLPSTVYRDLTNDVNQITSIATRANMLAGQTGQMLSNLGASGGYPFGTAVTNWHTQITTESNAISEALTTAANVLNLQPQQLANDAATLAALQSQALSSTGRQQALQTLAGVTATIGQSIQKSQSTLATALQGMMTYETAQRDQQAMFQAVNDQDLETTLTNECAAISSLGGTLPKGCTGTTQ